MHSHGDLDRNFIDEADIIYGSVGKCDYACCTWLMYHLPLVFLPQALTANNDNQIDDRCN